MRVLHILPRWIGGGPERDLIELAHQDREISAEIERRILVLDRPLSAPLLVAARRVGLHVISEDWQSALTPEVESADVVEIGFWNHPLLHQLFRQRIPACRLVIRSAVAGNSLPQVIPTQLDEYSDLWILTAPAGHGRIFSRESNVSSEHIPALMDVRRLEDYQPGDHPGIRAVYVGSLEPHKMHLQLPEILESISPDVSIDLAGDAADETRESLEREFRRRGLSERVRVLGHVENISSVLATADIFIYPLSPAGSGTSEKALQEAMWVGLAPVVMAGTAADGWINSGVNGILASSIGEFAHAVNGLAQDVVTRGAIGRAAREYANAQFDPVRNSDRIRQVHAAMLSLPKRDRLPLGEPSRTGSTAFLASLGLQLDEFESLIDPSSSLPDQVRFMLVHGEGGIAHYLSYFPDDNSLREWGQPLGYRKFSEGETLGVDG